MQQLSGSWDFSCQDTHACPGPGPTIPAASRISTDQPDVRSAFLSCSAPRGREGALPSSLQLPAHTTQFEELPHIWPREQVFEDPIHVQHSLPIVLRPGLGYHSGQESTKFLQILTGEPLKDTGLRL